MGEWLKKLDDLPGADLAERGRTRLADYGKKHNHPLNDLVGWYADDLEVLGAMTREDFEKTVADYVSLRDFHRR